MSKQQSKKLWQRIAEPIALMALFLVIVFTYQAGVTLSPDTISTQRKDVLGANSWKSVSFTNSLTTPDYAVESTNLYQREEDKAQIYEIQLKPLTEQEYSFHILNVHNRSASPHRYLIQAKTMPSDEPFNLSIAQQGAEVPLNDPVEIYLPGNTAKAISLGIHPDTPIYYNTQVVLELVPLE